LEDSNIEYLKIHLNEFYGLRNNRNPTGELDVCALYKNYMLIFEFKTFDAFELRKKAYLQLQRATDYFLKPLEERMLSSEMDFLSPKKIYTFYTYWDENANIQIESIRSFYHY